ncbi:helix-turn-helix domain-containing protein [Algiphilus sp. W345]|uniref:Helix-turn-helix domain-containing protein n=1 Tax=Banduia mediterranea TaxID=3075609 RepID=A0ABU2WM46_9GAMM|nr:helix-turn-helix domain-containing protein [Algiphilus sp. W345]MDT0498952.1 helix-turn-helix domain-containing protein [Algiphilus sp. W345]
MPSSNELMPAPLYLELAPSAVAAAQIDHLFVFRDTGALSNRESGRFATDLFTLSVTCGSDTDDGPNVSLAPPRPDFVPRRSSFCGIVAGLGLSAQPEQLPGAEALAPLTLALGRVRQGDHGLPSLVAALDDLARGLSFGAPPQTFSDRTERRRARADTGVSRRRLAATRRFRQLLGDLARYTRPLSDLALDAGYYDQSHMSAACRTFAGRPPGALRSQAAPRVFGLSLQDARLKDRLRLVIM